jgi:hypothetical protein
MVADREIREVSLKEVNLREVSLREVSLSLKEVATAALPNDAPIPKGPHLQSL